MIVKSNTSTEFSPFLSVGLRDKCKSKCCSRHFSSLKCRNKTDALEIWQLMRSRLFVVLQQSSVLKHNFIRTSVDNSVSQTAPTHSVTHPKKEIIKKALPKKYSNNKTVVAIATHHRANAVNLLHAHAKAFQFRMFHLDWCVHEPKIGFRNTRQFRWDRILRYETAKVRECRRCLHSACRNSLYADSETKRERKRLLDRSWKYFFN